MNRAQRSGSRWRRLAGTLVVLVIAAPGASDPGGTIARGDPAARLPKAETASEAWDLVARFDSGHFVFSQSYLTHRGLGDNKGCP